MKVVFLIVIVTIFYIRQTESCDDDQNYAKSCKYWNRRGYCSGKHKSFMEKYCKRSCGFCKNCARNHFSCTDGSWCVPNNKRCNGYSDCNDASDERHCPNPINGGFSAWRDSACSASCGVGEIVRTRTCTNPAPQYGGADCQGNTRVVVTCDAGECPTCNDDEFTCEAGVPYWFASDDDNKWRSEHCIQKSDICDGFDQCNDGADEQNCPPIHGGYTEWSSWTECSVTCGEGMTNRVRTCSNPYPEFGGNGCEGEATQTEDCYLGDCPPDTSEGDDTARCDPGIVGENEHVLNGYLYDASPELGSWYAADLYCQTRGGELAYHNIRGEQWKESRLEIMEGLNTRKLRESILDSSKRPNLMYIGLRRVDGKWTWMDGTFAPDSDIMWSGNEEGTNNILEYFPDSDEHWALLESWDRVGWGGDGGFQDLRVHDCVNECGNGIVALCEYKC